MPDLFSEIPLDEMIAEAEREVRMRRAVYPKFSKTGKMTPAQERQIAVMEAIAAKLKEVKNGNA